MLIMSLGKKKKLAKQNSVYISGLYVPKYTHRDYWVNHGYFYFSFMYFIKFFFINIYTNYNKHFEILFIKIFDSMLLQSYFLFKL